MDQATKLLWTKWPKDAYDHSHLEAKSQRCTFLQTLQNIFPPLKLRESSAIKWSLTKKNAKACNLMWVPKVLVWGEPPKMRFWGGFLMWTLYKRFWTSSLYPCRLIQLSNGSWRDVWKGLHVWFHDLADLSFSWKVWRYRFAFIPDICQFWDTTTLLSLVKVHQMVRKLATK